jgi:two-component system sensor histidine kinase UhpB
MQTASAIEFTADYGAAGAGTMGDSVHLTWETPCISRDRRARGVRLTVHVARTSLLTRIFALNVAIFAVAGLVLALTPATVSSEIALREAIVLAVVLAGTLAVNFVALRHAFRPLRRLTEAMETLEVVPPGRRIPVVGQDAEIMRLTAAYNEMLDRLEGERRESVRRSLAAQEGERLRVARELHDGIGQSLTALLLQIERIARQAPEDLHEQLVDAREATRATLDEVREVARRLRPEALDDLGLANAIAALCQRVAEQGGIAVQRRVDAHLAPLSPEGELVVFRVAQEALTNTLRHAGATAADVRLRADGDVVELVVRDDGRGLEGSVPGSGIAGMHERALLLDGTCALRTRPEGGTEVRLRIPNTEHPS